MSSFLFGFALVLIVSLGARDQLLVARLAGRTGPGLVVAGALAATLSAGIMAWAGAWVADTLFPGARTMLVALALAAAAIELMWPMSHKAPREPTHSVVAAFMVLLARQWGDAGRFLIFALAAATALPWLVAAGGALGGIGAVVLGWLAGRNLETALPLRKIRLALGAMLLLAAMTIGLSVRGII